MRAALNRAQLNPRCHLGRHTIYIDVVLYSKRRHKTPAPHLLITRSPSILYVQSCEQENHNHPRQSATKCYACAMGPNVGCVRYMHRTESQRPSAELHGRCCTSARKVPVERHPKLQVAPVPSALPCGVLEKTEAKHSRVTHFTHWHAQIRVVDNM